MDVICGVGGEEGVKRDLRDLNAEKRGSYNGKRDPNQKRSDHKKRW